MAELTITEKVAKHLDFLVDLHGENNDGENLATAGASVGA